MNLEKISGAILKRETEKAFLITVTFGDMAKKDVWFPKSQTEVRETGIFASSWILNQKSEWFGSELHHVNTEAL